MGKADNASHSVGGVQSQEKDQLEQMFRIQLESSVSSFYSNLNDPYEKLREREQNRFFFWSLSAGEAV